MTDQQLRDELLRIQDTPTLTAGQRAIAMAQLGAPVSRRERSMLLRKQREIIEFAGPSRSSSSF